MWHLIFGACSPKESASLGLVESASPTAPDSWTFETASEPETGEDSDTAVPWTCPTKLVGC